MAHGDVSQALAAQVRAAAERQQPLRLLGLGSKDFYGHTVKGETLQLSEHSGITHYEPTELVISARAGTPISEIEAALAANGQMLSFEPPAFTGTASLGGAIASGLGGPRRPWGGEPRDLMLGLVLLDSRCRQDLERDLQQRA